MRKRRGSGDVYRRLEALESEFDGDGPVSLYFEDGTRELLRCTDVPRLLGLACQPHDLSPDDVRRLDLISRSVRSVEPGGGHMIELTRAILLSPTTPPQ
jgi:hypothetical protein